jgi:hypothetical protein
MIQINFFYQYDIFYIEAEEANLVMPKLATVYFVLYVPCQIFFS